MKGIQYHIICALFYSIFEKSKKPDEGPQLICAAFGPDEEDQISQVVGSLKSI